MVRVEMKIMGDPSFIGDHYAEPIKVMGDGKIQKVERVGSYGGNVWDEQQGAFDLDQGEPLVTLHFRYPTDFDEVSGNYKFKSVDNYLRDNYESPYLLKKARTGYRLGHDTLYDHMMLDGLEDAYTPGRPMGHFAEQCAKKYGFTREEQDQFAMESCSRALNAQKKSFFEEIKTFSIL